MPTAKHEVKVIELIKLLRFGGQGLDDGALRVINEDKDVGEFKDGVFANFDPGRQAIDDRTFGGADQALRAFVEIIAFQIQGEHQSVAGFAFGVAAHKNETFTGFEQACIQIVLHGLLGDLVSILARFFFQINFRQDEVEGGW